MNRPQTSAFLGCLLALLCLGPFAAQARAKLSSKEERKQKKLAKKAFVGKDWEQVAAAVRALGGSKKTSTWKFMVGIAERSPAESPVAAALRQALVGMKHPAIRKKARKSAQKSRSAEVRRQLVLAFAELKDWPPVITSLKDRDEEVQFAGIYALSQAKRPEAVEPLIAAMEALDKTKAGNWFAIQRALTLMLGKKLKTAGSYRSVWKVLSAKGGLKSARPYTGGKAKKGALTSGTRLFGRSIESNRVVFILDCSGSMQAVDPAGPKTAAPGPAGGGKSTRRKNPNNPGGSSADKPKLLNRLQRAQKQLKKVLRALPARTRVNIIAYSSDHRVRLWRGPKAAGGRPQLFALTKENKDEACKFVDTFKPSGGTATDLALKLAYTVHGGRTFYLLSDGQPSRGGKPLPVKEVFDVMEKNKAEGRHVIIHTLGFVGAPKNLMQGLADRTGGKYTNIPPQ